MKCGNNTKIWHPEKSVLLNCVIGDDCTVHAPVWIGNNVLIGDRVKIQAFAFIPDGVTIEDDAFIGPSATFTNDKYPPSAEWRETQVGRHAVIGANATVVCGVKIGEYAMVGAGAVVTKDVPAGALVAGNPARKLAIVKEKAA